MENSTITLDGYQMIGGVHADTASIKNILAFHGVRAPHTGKPFTEAMVLGIGGGLGSASSLKATLARRLTTRVKMTGKRTKEF